MDFKNFPHELVIGSGKKSTKVGRDVLLCKIECILRCTIWVLQDEDVSHWRSVEVEPEEDEDIDQRMADLAELEVQFCMRILGRLQQKLTNDFLWVEPNGRHSRCKWESIWGEWSAVKDVSSSEEPRGKFFYPWWASRIKVAHLLRFPYLVDWIWDYTF